MLYAVQSSAQAAAMMNKKQDTLLMPENLRLGTTPKTSGLRVTIPQNYQSMKYLQVHRFINSALSEPLFHFTA
jgi:hypothetical protein